MTFDSYDTFLAKCDWCGQKMYSQDKIYEKHMHLVQGVTIIKKRLEEVLMHMCGICVDKSHKPFFHIENKQVVFKKFTPKEN